jgi:DNA-binding NtrC family response regulator
MARILIVDDEPHMRRILGSNLRQDKHEIAEAAGVAEARATLGGNDFDVVFTDQRMPDGEGLEVLAAVRENDSTIPVIMLTALASIELAVESMRQGAFDFLTKPFQPEVVRAAANRAAEHARLLRENVLLKAPSSVWRASRTFMATARRLRRFAKPSSGSRPPMSPS